ncbi:MAG: hypothetical protein CL847_03465 [Crocinitomicaceae bacterium]|nr:hypothetical protein [Crocinitomicaceae bacterium]
MKSSRQYLTNLILLKTALVLCFAFASYDTFAQDSSESTETVRVVVGSMPIPFAVCTNLTTNETSVSDVNGILILPKRNVEDSLEFRSLGFESLVVLPTEKISNEIRLNESPVGLDAVLISSNISPAQVQRDDLKVVDNLQVTSVVSTSAPSKSTDLLMNTGQVMVQQSQQGGGSPIIRGFEANRILLVIDGVRMNNAIYRSGHLQNAITVDPNSLEQVQIVMGPSSVKYGSDALGGVVHFQTHRPRFRRDGSEDIWSGFASVQTLSNNNSSVLSAMVEGGGEKWASLVSISKSEYGDLRMGENRMHGDSAWGLATDYIDTIDGLDVVLENSDPNLQVGTGYEQTDFMHKLRFAIPGGALQTNVQYSISSNIPRYDKINNISDGTYSPKWAEWNYGPQKRLMTALSWEQFLRIPGSIYTTLAYQNIQESRLKRRLGFDIREEQYEDLDVISLSSIWRSSPFKGNGWGYEMGVDGQFNGLESTSNTPEVFTRYANDGSKMLTLGAFASAKRTNEDRVLYAGIRYNYSAIEANYDLSSYAFGGLGFDNVSLKNAAITGSLGYEAPVGRKIKSHSSFSTGFRNPNIDDATKIREKNGVLLIPNNEINPEYIYSLDQSISLSPFEKRSKLNITVAGFFSLWADAIVPFPTTFNGNSVIEFDGEPVFVYMNNNLENSFIYGARCEIQSQFADNMSFNGTVNYTRGHTIVGGTPLSHIPPIFGRVGLLKNSSSWSFETYILFNGSKKFDLYGDAATDNLVEALDGTHTPAWWTWNIETTYDISSDLHLQAGVQNILDVHYKPFASGISAPGLGFYIALNTNF